MTACAVGVQVVPPHQHPDTCRSVAAGWLADCDAAHTIPRTLVLWEQRRQPIGRTRYVQRLRQHGGGINIAGWLSRHGGDGCTVPREPRCDASHENDGEGVMERGVAAVSRCDCRTW